MDEVLMSHLKELRSDKLLTQEQLADAVDVSRQTIVAIERGNYVPSVALAIKLAKKLHCSVEELFYWKESA